MESVRSVMTASDFLRLPPGVRAAFVVMLWPAIWAAAQFVVVLAGDLIRMTKTHGPSRATRGAAVRG
jgi:hypothetical protein